MKIAPITKGGQISVPAEVRRRWGTRKVTVEDKGDHVVLRPAPDDPVEAAYGAFAGRFRHTSEELRAMARVEEQRIEERRWRNR